MQWQLPEDVSGVICFIGVGSNLDNATERCLEAICRLSSVSGTKVLRRSSLYRTEPVGFTEQDWFVNTVVEIRTVLTPRELLKALREVEDGMGRVRGPKWGPRVIDLDILLYGQEVIQEEGLDNSSSAASQKTICPWTSLRNSVICNSPGLRCFYPRVNGQA